MNTTTSAAPPHTAYFPAPPRRSAPHRWLACLRDEWAELRRFAPVVQNMVGQELRVKYQRSLLGFLWTLLNPILMMATLTVVFANLLGQGDRWRQYALLLFSGMLPWGLLAGSLNECAFCIIWNENLIRKIYVPKLVFPLTRVLMNLVTFGLSLAALFVLLVPLGARFSTPMLLLPIPILLFTLFTLGLGLLIATLNTFYRDCSHLVGVFLQAWYFATPILYEADQFPSHGWLFRLNPAYPFIRLFQVIIRYRAWPDLSLLLAATAIALVSLGVGYAAFKANEDKLVFRL